MLTINASEIESNINKPFMPIFSKRDRYMILYGGAGSGKSIAMAQKIVIRIMRAMKEEKPHKFLCMRKTLPAARKSIYSLLMDVINSWGLRPLCKVNKSDLSITFQGGSEILIMGLDDPEKIKSIYGITGIWLEEATEFSYDDFKQLDLRLRGETWDYKQIALTFNPIDEQHWIRKNLFTDDMQADIESGKNFVHQEFSHDVDGKDVVYSLSVMHSTFRDNRFLDDVYKARLQNLINEDSNYYDIYCLGRWGVLRGLIFDRWDTCDKWPEHVEHRGIGVDFGFSSNPTAIVEVAFVGDDLYIREHLYKPGLTNKQIATSLRAVTSGDCVIVADCAEPKSIAEIRSYNLPCIGSTKGKDSVLFGLQRMKQFNIILMSDSINLIKEFQSYKWSENRNGEPLNVPVKFNDHLIDAARYIAIKLKGNSQVRFDIASTTDKKDPNEVTEDHLHKEKDDIFDDGFDDGFGDSEDIWD